ncbi:AbrB/MazE/SpoVT family DNA-binding domain-containing protein [Halorubrum sp. T3]|uniref:AbrB/MazE/SpoVT family DNA-binding domain-containing protein n=1 Tax=Halorubrum sp. T3 TaxID=1194088 RepID=UPI0003823A55|nr:AbrB/MazE/SpoVT family DNA-binding domain-containing protein [Halorubrum sp. T3]
MTAENPPEETTISNRGTVTIPAGLRRRLDIKAGDKLRWTVTENGDLTVAVVRQRYGAFEDADRQAPMGGDGLETHDLAGHEKDSAFTENS